MFHARASHVSLNRALLQQLARRWSTGGPAVWLAPPLTPTKPFHDLPLQEEDVQGQECRIHSRVPLHQLYPGALLQGRSVCHQEHRDLARGPRPLLLLNHQCLPSAMPSNYLMSLCVPDDRDKGGLQPVVGVSARPELPGSALPSCSLLSSV